MVPRGYSRSASQLAVSDPAIWTAAIPPDTLFHLEREVGIRVHLRDVATLDDLVDATAPAPVEPGDLMATVDGKLYRIEVVLVPASSAQCVTALARRVGLVR